MSKWVILLPLIYAAAAMAQPAWTWVDENGHRHYSDRPVPGAEQIELAGAQGFAAQQARPAQPESPAANEQAPAESPYRAFNIVSPAHEETLWNIGGVLPVQLEIEPQLQRGHRLDVYLDGARVSLGATSPQFTIPDVFRGLHTLQAVISDSSGREVLRSLEISVMVQQTSILN